MIHLGDITKIDGKRIEPVDVIVGGSPCQDLSVAGKRAGLAGERSGLYMDQIRIIKEMRDADHQRGRPDELCRPRYMVWENVPGAFSSQKGADFAAVIEEVIRVVEPQAPDVPVPEKGWPTAGCIYDDMGRWSVAWRVHDAQFWGVPQRRRRIALVADFGGLSAPEVLFERKGLRWDPAPSGTTRQGAASDAEGSSGGAISFQERGGKPGGGKGILIQNERTGALSTLNNQSVFNIGSYHSNAWKSDNPHSGVYETEVSKTLDALNCGYPACNQGGTAVVCARCFNQLSQSGIYKEDETSVSLTVCGGTYGGGSECLAVYDGAGVTCPTNASNPQPGDPCHTLSTDSRNLVVTYQKVTGPIMANSHPGSYTGQDAYNDMLIAGIDARNGVENGDLCGTLQAKPNGGFPCNCIHPVRINKSVRRLTPLECERLQGYQDGWTDIGEWVDSKGKRHDSSDSARYKALGNSIALPFWFWLLRRISAQYERPATLGSLFDGISGFCLIWARCNGAKNCRWSSEIEEFPMAVTRKHFGDEKTGEVGDIEKYL